MSIDAPGAGASGVADASVQSTASAVGIAGRAEEQAAGGARVAKAASGEHSANAAIDGLRALAIVAVLAVHSGVPGAEVGWIGVDLFFVLSGFLITTLLVGEFRRTGAINLPKFWVRRFLRLMPAYWLYAAVVTALLWGFGLGWRQVHGGWTPGMYTASIWAYFINYVPQGGIWEFQWLTLHLWSLAVEEQFYLVWPLLCSLLVATGRLGTAAWVLAGCALVRTWLGNESTVTAHLDGRGFALVLGCATALRLADSEGFRRWMTVPRAAVPLSLLGAVTFMTAAVVSSWMTELQLHRWVAPFVSCGFALLVAHLWVNPTGAIGRWLSAPVAVYVGRISYGIYLYHMAAHELTWGLLLADIEDWNRWPKFALRLVVYCGLALGMAALSYHFWERKFLALKQRFR